jgi:hypothetical protein
LLRKHNGIFARSLFDVKILGKNIFDDAYFREAILVRDFCLFKGGHFFRSIFLGKIFSTNCSAYIAKNPRGPVGEGVQGAGSGEYLGGLTRYINKKPPGVLWFFTRKAHPCSTHPR